MRRVDERGVVRQDEVRAGLREHLRLADDLDPVPAREDHPHDRPHHPANRPQQHDELPPHSPLAPFRGEGSEVRGLRLHPSPGGEAPPPLPETGRGSGQGGCGAPSGSRGGVSGELRPASHHQNDGKHEAGDGRPRTEQKPRLRPVVAGKIFHGKGAVEPAMLPCETPEPSEPRSASATPTGPAHA